MTKKKWILLLLLFVVIAPARFTGIDRFATVDEPWWVISGSNYYYALTHGDFENTIYDYHPAVTTTWVVTAGMLSYFPEYRGIGQGYFDVRKPLFENFMQKQGHDALGLVRASRLIQSALLVMLALLVFFLLQKLIHEHLAFLSVAFAMNAPFFLGNSRLLNHEGMLAMFSLICALAMLAYLKEHHWIYLLLSGAAFGLAQLTKSSSIVLAPLIGLMLFVGVLKQDRQHLIGNLGNAAKIFAGWLLAAGFVYFILWPGMWAAPGKMIYEVYGNAFSYAFQGARLEAAQSAAQPKGFDLAEKTQGMVQYIAIWLSSSTPLTWLGLLLLPLVFTSKDESNVRAVSAYLLILGALFIMLFGIAQGRNAPHYILTSFAGLDLAASIGLGFALIHIQQRWKFFQRVFLLPAAFLILLAFQLGSALPQFPYYFTYKNPLTETGGVRGYGEGLDLAAKYLSQKSNAQDFYVIAYAGRGCFSYFFPGRTEHIRLALQDGAPAIEDIKKADYLVVYTVRQIDKPEGAALIKLLQNIPPEKIIHIDGIEYARIYQVSMLPKTIMNILSQ